MRFLLMIVSVLILAGCAGLGGQKDVEYKTIPVLPEDALLIDCDVAPPPAKDIYMAASDKEREGLLTEYGHTQLKNLFVCNQRLSSLRGWKQKMIQHYAPPEPDKKE